MWKKDYRSHNFCNFDIVSKKTGRFLNGNCKPLVQILMTGCQLNACIKQMQRLNTKSPIKMVHFQQINHIGVIYTTERMSDS